MFDFSEKAREQSACYKFNLWKQYHEHKASDGTAIDPVSWSQGSSCCVWYAGLQIVFLYHWNVMLAKHREQLRGCKLTGRDSRVFFTLLEVGEKAWLGWQIFPGGVDWFFSPLILFLFFVFLAALHFHGFVWGVWKGSTVNVLGLRFS